MAKGRKYAEYHKFYVSGDAVFFLQMPFFKINVIIAPAKSQDKCAILVML